MSKYLRFYILLLSFCTFGTFTQVHAASFSALFDNGTSWFICQGYNNAKLTHTAADAYAVDISGGSCDTSASLRSVKSPTTGTIASYGPGAGSLCINTFDGRSIALIHIDFSGSIGQAVSRGDSLGVIAPPNTRANGGVAHLHLQAWSTPNCYNPASIIPLDSLHDATVCSMPDMTPTGPNVYNNGTWSGTTFVVNSCPSASMRVYRFWSLANKHHFYTASEEETNYVRTSYSSSTWTYEGAAFSVPTYTAQCPTGSSPVYRFWSSTNKAHFYTIDEQEKQTITATYSPSDWAYEGVAYCASPTSQPGWQPLYRFWSSTNKGHFYTMSAAEKDTITKNYSEDEWKYEGIAYYVLP